MNKTITIAAGALLGIAAYAAPAAAQDVGVSVTVGQPGFYGRIDIGDVPRPRIIYREPVVIEHVTVVEEPIYLHVRPGHAKHWSKHCHEYNACGQRVYFVNDDWYNTVYVREYHEHHGHHDDGDGHDRDHHDHDGDRRDHDEGHHDGKGHGHGKGKKGKD